MITAVFLVTLYLYWIHHKNTVNSLGQNAIKSYTELHQAKSKKALSHLKSGKTDPAIKLLNDWEKIKKGDRIYHLKRKLLLTLSEQLHSQKNYPELLYWSQVWHRLDERDITAKAYWFEALRHSPNHSEEGLTRLIQEWQRFPTNNALSKFYINIAIEANDQTILNQIITKYIGQKWKIYGDNGAGFNKGITKLFKVSYNKGNQWKIAGSLPSNISRLRVDPPAYSEIRISDIQLVLNGKVHKIPLTVLKLRGMKQKEKWLKSNGTKDPFFLFDVSKFFKNIERKDIHIVIHFKMIVLEISVDVDK